MKRNIMSCVKLVSVVLLGIWLFGCAAPRVETRRFFWPALPDRPRIEWLASYSSQKDFDKGGFSSFMTGIVGEVAPTFFDKPLDIKSDGQGKVYVTDVGMAKIFVYDMVKKDVHFLDSGRSKGFARPSSIALDAAGNLYVAENEDKTISVFDKTERLVRTIELAGKITSFAGIAVDSERQRLVCVDMRAHKVEVFSLKGDPILTIGGPGESDGKFNYPNPVTLSKNGEIYVGDAMNARIQVFSPDGKFLRKFGHRGDGPSEFELLKGVALDSDENVYVTDGKGHKVIIFSPKGEYLLTFGGRANVLESDREVAAGFLLPQGIHIDQRDRIYIVDQMNLRFQEFQYISDRFLEKNPIAGYDPNAPLPTK